LSTKVAANPIPENQYERFKSKLNEYSEKFSLRNLMLFSLGVATGYRVQDLVDLTIKDIKQALDDGEFIIQEKKQYNTWKTYVENHPNSKKKKPEPRAAPIKKNLARLLKEYVKNKKASEYAFTSQKGNGNEYISEKSYSAILSEVGTSMGLKHISGHSMRKTYANRIWEINHDLEEVRLALGHKSIEVTKFYLGIDKKVINNAASIVDDFI
jgi:integrase